MYRNRSNKKEMMDGETNASILTQNYKEIEKVNQLLGGYNTLYKGLEYFCQKDPAQKSLIILDIGCGAGDNIDAMRIWCKKHHINAHFVGVDLNETAIELAQKRFRHDKDIQFICSDYRHMSMTNGIDLVVASLFNHHLTNDENILFLKWSQVTAAKGLIINDLHRHPIAYYFIKWIAILASTSIYFRNDAPLSVLRAFKRRDWVKLAVLANMTLKIKWNWAFRWLVIYEKK